MRARDYRDVITGAALFVVGAVIAVYSLITYPVGTLTRMGPGLFPTSLGALLAALGLVIGVPAWFRSGGMPEIHVRPLVVIIGSILLFVIVLNLFGVVPAVIALTIGAVLADDQLGFKQTAILALVMAAATELLFRVLLGVPYQPFRWPL